MPNNRKPRLQMLSVSILIGSFVIAIALILQGLFSYLGAQSDKDKDKDPKEIYENIGYVRVDKSPALGDPNAPVTVIEYTDFDCPVCKLASDEVVPSLKKEYITTGKVKFIFKSLPIEHLHPNAFKKTEAAFCAKELGGDEIFFAYYDSLFEKFGFSIDLERELTAIAQQHGLNPDQFKDCLNSRKYRQLIKDEVLEANLIDSQGTPTWLVGKSDGAGIKDTIKVNGLLEYSYFRRIIQRQLEAI